MVVQRLTYNPVTFINISRLLTVLYTAEPWPLTTTPMKRLHAAQHQRQRSRCLLKRQGTKRRSQSKNWTTNDREHTQRKKTALAWSHDTDGPPAHTTASTVLGGSVIHERTRSTKDQVDQGPGSPRTRSTKNKLERHHQERRTKIWTYLGRGRGCIPRQTTEALQHAAVPPYGHELNQRQGQGQGQGRGQKMILCNPVMLLKNLHLSNSFMQPRHTYHNLLPVKQFHRETL